MGIKIVPIASLPPQVRQRVIARQQAVARAKTNMPRMQDSAEYQRRAALSKDQKFVEAVDQLTASRKKYNDAVEGRDTGEERARREARNLVKKAARDQGIE